jgi:hypothetical protein
MNSLLIHPLSFLLAILWYEPTRDGEQGVLPFALVTTVDLLALFIFLLQRQISHWHDILTSDIEQGHLRGRSIDDPLATLVSQGNEQVEHRNFGGRPDTPESEIHQIQVMQESGYDIDGINHSGRDVSSSAGINTIRWNPRSVVGPFGGPAAGGRVFDQRLDGGETGGRFTDQRLDGGENSGRFTEVAMRGPPNVGWGTGMVQEEADLELVQREFIIDVGMDNSYSEDETPCPACPVGTPNTIYSHIHPVLRPIFDNTSQPVSPDGFQTPKEAPSLTGSMLENKI